LYFFSPFLKKTKKGPEAEFLVIFGASSFPARHEVYGKNIEEFVLAKKRARPQLVFSLTKNTASGDSEMYYRDL
jgi:hypothetical protein